MKKIVTIFYPVFLSALFVCQAPMTIFALQLVTNTEHVIDCPNLSGDDCQEDHFTKTSNSLILIPFQNYLSGTLSLSTIPGILPFLWKPPQ